MVAIALVATLPLTGGSSSADANDRIAGSDRFATAAAVSRASFSVGVPVVFVVTGRSFPDALTAGPAAAHRGGPVLLVERSAVPQSTRDELERLNPQSIVVVGGEGAVSDSVFREMEQHTDGTVERVSGADRHATAAAVSASSFPSSPNVYIAGSAGFSDALA